MTDNLTEIDDYNFYNLLIDNRILINNLYSKLYIDSNICLSIKYTINYRFDYILPISVVRYFNWL